MTTKNASFSFMNYQFLYDANLHKGLMRVFTSCLCILKSSQKEELLLNIAYIDSKIPYDFKF